MPLIDALLTQMQRNGVVKATLKSNSPLILTASDGISQPQGVALTGERVDEILLEIMPPNLRDAFRAGAETIFEYKSPFGPCPIRALDTGGISQVEITPGFNSSSLASLMEETTPLQATPYSSSPEPFSSPVLPLPNSSGHKDGPVPPEASGFNWGGFFLTWLWGLGNSVWLALVALVPGLLFLLTIPLHLSRGAGALGVLLLPLIGLGIRVFVGMKGNELAWKGRRWASVEDFKKVQKNWAFGSLGLVLVSPIFLIMLGAVLFPVFARARENARRTACQRRLTIVAAGYGEFAKSTGKFPSGMTVASWETAMQKYVPDQSNWRCPSLRRDDAGESFALNPNMAGIDPSQLPNAAQTPVLFDLEDRHLRGVNVAFADGHVMWFKKADFDRDFGPQIGH